MAGDGMAGDGMAGDGMAGDATAGYATAGDALAGYGIAGDAGGRPLSAALSRANGLRSVVMDVDAVYLAQLTLNGLILGLLYALIAAGLALMFGVLEIINFAHGELLMVGAYTMTFALPAVGLLYWPSLTA